MPWPQSTEYNAAIQNLCSSVSDDELRGGEPVVNALGIPIPFSGNFADVYKVHCPKTGNTWAVKCFTRESPGLKERYREISAHLSRARLPFTVDFRFVEPGIRIRGQWHPFLKMRWVEGFALNQFVADYVENRGTLKLLLPMWVKLSQILRRAEVAHCDLQHGNVLLVPASATGALSLKLIDYDGMYVPTLSGRRSAELGHPSYQHPQRLREGLFGPEVDRFSHLAIYCAIRCLIAGGQGLWKRFNNGENLLFRETDHKEPGASEVFRHLWSLPDPDVHALVGRVALATRVPLDRVPLLEDVASNGSAVPLSAEEEQTAREILGVASAGTSVSVPSEPAESDSGPEGPWWSSGTAGVKTELPGPLDTGPPAVTPPALSALRAPRRGKRGPLGQSFFGSAIGLLSAAVELIDRFLGRIAGKKNALVHRFLRLAAVLLLAVVLALLVSMALRIGEIITNSIGMKLALIPAGEFMMGSPESEEGRNGDEGPQHRVRITRAFYLGTTEVTQGQWESVMGTKPWSGKFYVKEGSDYAATYVGWEDAVKFCRKLSAKEGKEYRLPTEAEWEYACRAGTTTAYHFGADASRLGDYAWYHDNAFNVEERYAHQVGQKRPNGWGLYDMYGNVWEWCADWYDDEYYANSPADDATGPASGSNRVSRGGCWSFHAGNCRSSHRDGDWPDCRSSGLGFRVALVAAE